MLYGGAKKGGIKSRAWMKVLRRRRLFIVKKDIEGGDNFSGE